LKGRKTGLDAQQVELIFLDTPTSVKFAHDLNGMQFSMLSDNSSRGLMVSKHEPSYIDNYDSTPGFSKEHHK